VLALQSLAETRCLQHWRTLGYDGPEASFFSVNVLGQETRDTSASSQRVVPGIR
jgi:hypothetical protein